MTTRYPTRQRGEIDPFGKGVFWLILAVVLTALAPVARAGTESTAYTYDAVGRLLTVQASVDGTNSYINYHHDMVGNIVLRESGGSGGSVRITLAPAEVLALGARWRVNGGSWLESGDAYPFVLSAGTHTVSFSPVSHWASPSNLLVVVTANQMTHDAGVYSYIPPRPAVALDVEDVDVATMPEWRGSNSFNVCNVGETTLVYSVTASPDWLTVQPTGGVSVSTWQSHWAIAHAAGLSTGAYTGSITVSSDGADHSPTTIPCRLVVRPADPLNGWDEVALPIYGGPAGMAWGDGYYIVVASDGFSGICVSRDGIAWDYAYMPMTWEEIYDVVYGVGRFVACGLYQDWMTGEMGPLFVSSSDGTNWTRTALTATDIPQTIAYGDGTFVAAGAVGTAFRSTDGLMWTNSVIATGESFCGLGYGDGVFVAAGYAGVLARSVDAGRTWSSPDSGTNAILRDVAWGAGTFVVVGDNGTMLVSTNRGVHWTPVFVAGINDSSLNGIIYSGRYFVAVGNNGLVLKSLDGYTWQIADAGLTGGLSGVVIGADHILVGGDSGGIYRSWGPPDTAGRWRSIRAQEGQAILEFEGFLGRDYGLQTTPNLLHVWSNLPGSFCPTTEVNRLRVPLSDPPRFYRLKSDP